MPSDFETGRTDRVDLSAIAGSDDFADVQAIASEVNGSTILDLGKGNQVMLYQVPLAAQSAGDFISG
jgi:hypothetical protein